MMTDLFERHHQWVYAYALKLSCDPMVAEDVTQETFIKAWQHLDQLNEEQAIKGWLRKICLNEYRMYVRRLNHGSTVQFDGLEGIEKDELLYQQTAQIPTPEEEVLVDESVKELQNGCFLAMARRLSVEQRMVFSLVDMFGMGLDEVAILLDTTKPAVKGLLYRARMNLDQFFSGHCEWIHVGNPCKCKAWIEFAESRAKNQQAVAHDIPKSELNYMVSGYQYDPSVREKIRKLYASIPDRKPSDAWYQKIIENLQINRVSPE